MTAAAEKVAAGEDAGLAGTAARVLVQGFERMGLRGAPTIFRQLSRFPSLRRRWSTVALPTGERISFPTFDPYWARSLWAGCRYEPDVELILTRLGRLPDALLVDCGANIGYWTVRSRSLGYKRAIAIEANPALIPLIDKNVRQNRIAAKVRHAAIYERSGETLLLSNTEEHAVSSVGESGVPVTSLSLADLLKDAPERYAVIKLDVEGAEIAAMTGAGNRNLVYVYEDWPRSGMPVTKYALERGLEVAGMALDGTVVSVRSLEDSFAFNTSTRNEYGPSNLVAMEPGEAEPRRRLLGNG